ncbi:MAG: hypothetical protein ACI8UO_005995, partial [Verrucomicrobiales bacterium]
EKCPILNAILANEPSGYPDHEALTKLLVRYILDDLQATEKICDTAQRVREILDRFLEFSEQPKLVTAGDLTTFFNSLPLR